MNITEQTSDPTLWRYPSLWSANRTIHLRNLESEVARLEIHNKALRDAAQDFINKCNSGRAQSRDSYYKFTMALSAHTPTGKEK